MKNLIYKFILIYLSISGCTKTQQYVEKEIKRCVISNSENNFDSDGKINASNLAINFENLLLKKQFLIDNSSAAYQDLFNRINEAKIDSTELESLIRDSYKQNLDLLYSPILYATIYACVVEKQEKFPNIFDESESLQGLFQASVELRRTKDLATLVISMTNTIPKTEFQKNTLYRLPVIIAIYDIMEQTYSRTYGVSE